MLANGDPFDFNISEFQELNNNRSLNGFGYSAHDRDVLYWTTALAGEVGEACNIVKKIERGDDLPDFHDKLREELADIFIYLCLLAENQDIDLEDAVIDKFNKVNGRKDVDMKDCNIKKRRNK